MSVQTTNVQLRMDTVCMNPFSLTAKNPTHQNQPKRPKHQLKSHLVLYVKGLEAGFFVVVVVEGFGVFLSVLYLILHLQLFETLFHN